MYFLASLLLQIFFLINMCGSSLVLPWSCEHWKHSLEEKASRDGSECLGLGLF